VCERRFDSADELYEHVRNEHLDAQRRRQSESGCWTCEWHECRVCTPFQSLHKLMRHIQMHTGAKPYKCERCGAGFPSTMARTAHQRGRPSSVEPAAATIDKSNDEPTQRRAYPCHHSGCTRTFSSPSNRSKHMLIHRTDKAFKCTYPECNGRLFTRIDHYRRHLRRIHKQQIV